MISSNLRKCKGTSLEQVLAVMKKKKIPWEYIRICEEPSKTPPSHYFKGARLMVDSLDDLEILRQEFGLPIGDSISHPHREFVCYAFYKLKEDFDMKSLSGTYVFQKGRLVEKVEVKIKYSMF